MQQNPLTPAQVKALGDYNAAARELAAASIAMRQAQESYNVAANEYLRAHGAARQAGVI